MSSVHSSLPVTPVILVFREGLVFGSFLNVCSKFSFRLPLHCISARAGLILLQLFQLKSFVIMLEISSYGGNVLKFFILL